VWHRHFRQETGFENSLLVCVVGLGRILSQYHLVSFAKCLIYQMKPQNVRLISSICELLFFLYLPSFSVPNRQNR
jgi:hypothetical protein